MPDNKSYQAFRGDEKTPNSTLDNSFTPLQHKPIEEMSPMIDTKSNLKLEDLAVKKELT